MLYGKFLTSPHAHAKLTKLDTAAAEKLAGVKMWLAPADAAADTALDRAWASMTGSAGCKPRDISIKGRVLPDTVRSLTGPQ